MGGEGLELHVLHWPHMDSIDLDPQPTLGIGSDNFWILNRIRMDLGVICRPKNSHVREIGQKVLEEITP